MELTKMKYKETEVGLIPEDWNFIKIQSLMDDKIITSHLDGNHGALYPRSNEFTDNGVPYITANDFLKGHVNFNNVRYLPISRAEQFQKGIAKDGDVLFAHNATVGPTAVLETDLDYVILSTTATYFRTDNNKLNNFYLRYFFESEFFIKQYIAVMRQSTRNQIPITQQRKFSIILPPTLKEQKAIAIALSDVDELISNLDQLFTKKKAIKQGAMQQLLTPPHKGGKRLSGFTGEWVEKTLGDVGDVQMCRRIFSYQTSTRGDVPFYKIGTFGKEPDAFISWDLYQEFRKKYSFPKKGYLLISASGTIGRTVEYLGEDAYYQDSNIIWIDNDEKLITNKYLYYTLKIIKYNTEGSTIKRLYNSIIKSSQITIPPTLNEQKAIAQILSDMDKEIMQLETKKAKYQDIKQGMMQELLTGKTRLV